MEEIAAIGATQSQNTQDVSTSGFGLAFDDLLNIVLTQLTYQDPLKPVENFEFVSQLAQFSQIQQTEIMTDHLEALLSAGTTTQATSLLGRVVDVPSDQAITSGTVRSIAFENGDPRITLETFDGRVISNISMSSVSQIRDVSESGDN